MQDDLYFIKLLADGVEAIDQTTGMSQAFADIEAMGRNARFRRGLGQFHAFMREAARAVEVGDAAPIEWAGGLDLVLESAGEIRARWRLPESGQPTFRARVGPGTYVLRLSTGRLIWRATLASTDVLWSHAYPVADLPMAADTGERQEALPSLIQEVLSGSFVIRVYPGIRTGSLAVTLQC